MVKQGRTTIGLKKTTKSKLDHNRAPGQCYDGFLCQMMELWEANIDSKNGGARLSGSNQSAEAQSRSR